MKKRPVDFERAVVAHHQTAEIPQPREGALYRPASFVAPQNAAILRRSAVTVQAVRGDQQNAPQPQSLAQRIAVVAHVSNDPQRFLPRTPRVMPSAYADRRERRFREPDFRRGRRTKVVPQRNSAAVDHHHPLRPLAPLGFSDFGAPFLAGAKLPSRNDSLHSSSRRWFNSLRNARQIFNQTPCSSQSRSRRQHVEGCGYFSGKSCQRAPLRRIHRIPSSTRRFSIHGRPPLRCLGGLGSKGAIFFHCASVSNGPARAIDPPAALLTLLIHDFAKLNHHLLNSLYWVVQQLLGSQSCLSTSSLSCCPFSSGCCCIQRSASTISVGYVEAARICATNASGYRAIGATSCCNCSGVCCAAWIGADAVDSSV